MDMMCLQVNEGTKLLEAGVAKSAAEIDLAMVNGGGGIFGPFALCKGMGWDKVPRGALHSQRKQASNGSSPPKL